MSDLKTAKRLTRLRKSRGLKASWVATQMGISAPGLCFMEKGKRNWTPELERKFLKAIGGESK